MSGLGFGLKFTVDDEMLANGKIIKLTLRRHQLSILCLCVRVFFGKVAVGHLTSFRLGVFGA